MMALINLIYAAVLLIVSSNMPADNPMKPAYYVSFIILLVASQILNKIGGKK